MQTPFGIADQQQNVQTFTSSGSSNSWQSWIKPKGARMVTIIAIGAGGGGGSGYAGSGTDGRGGAGAGSGAISRLEIPADMLPDQLYILPGSPGLGGASVLYSALGINGTSGGASYVSIKAGSKNAADLYLIANGGVLGPGGSTTAGVETGGAGGTAATAANCILSQLGNASFVGGVAGGNSAASVTALATLPISGGAGGGNVAASATQAGGNITGAGVIPTLVGGSAGATTPAASGFDWQFIMSTGGAGSASVGVGITAGPAGGAGFGSGGGGGGAGITSSRSGAGGRGGEGVVMIVAV